jgi:hypothetical protein
MWGGSGTAAETSKAAQITAREKKVFFTGSSFVYFNSNGNSRSIRVIENTVGVYPAAVGSIVHDTHPDIVISPSMAVHVDKNSFFTGVMVGKTDPVIVGA